MGISIALGNQSLNHGYNKWRKEYRRKRVERGLCHRCGRPLIEDSARTHCENCMNDAVERTKLRRNFNGDN